MAENHINWGNTTAWGVTLTDGNHQYLHDGTTWNIPPPTKEMREDDIYSMYGHYEDKPKKERKVGMETLYEVIVVSKDREILLEDKIVAENPDQAKLEVDINSVLRDKHLKFKDVTILCIELGDVKIRKEVQKVKVVDKDEE